MEKLGIEVEGDSLDRKEGASVAASMALADVLTSGRKERRDKLQVEGPGEVGFQSPPYPFENVSCVTTPETCLNLLLTRGRKC